MPMCCIFPSLEIGHWAVSSLFGLHTALPLAPFSMQFTLAVVPFCAFLLSQGAACSTPGVATVIEPVVAVQLSTARAALHAFWNLRTPRLAMYQAWDACSGMGIHTGEGATHLGRFRTRGDVLPWSGR
jgi:hypothetical protein